MEPKYQDNHVTVYNKSCTDMSELADDSVQCVVTSPPYFGLRRYQGNQDLIWGGENHHEHSWGQSKIVAVGRNDDDFNERTQERYGKYSPVNNYSQSQPKTATTGAVCSVCGAWRGAFGLEPNPELYVSHLIEILREVRRVLRKDGTLFLNLGDSYASSPPGNKNPEDRYATWQTGGSKSFKDGEIKRSTVVGNLKPKDLCLIPFRVALAAQEDGWWVRSVIIWSKNNPMPESVKDRPTESHEYILLLTKSGDYFWDMEAVREEAVTADREADRQPHRFGGNKGLELREQGIRTSGAIYNPVSARNLRSVWSFSTQPYPEAHFATFPEELPERCIKAGTPEYGCCDKCGRPYERVVESKQIPRDELPKDDPRYRPNRYIENKYADELREGFECGMYKESKTLGWKQACTCAESKPVASLVLDPFAGSGTTLWVAKRLNRKAVGYELSAEYVELIKDRNRQQVLC